MKTKFISMALFAILSTMSVSCQKENIMDNTPESVVSEVCTMQYAINGVTHSVIINNETEEQALMQYPFSRMFRHYVGGVVLDLQSCTGYYKDLQSSYIHNLS